MSLPVSEALLDAITAAKGMNWDEGKVPSVVLINSSLYERWRVEIGEEGPVPTEDCDPAPMISMLRLIEDDSIPDNEVCVFCDEDYMEHEYLKATRES